MKSKQILIKSILKPGAKLKARKIKSKKELALIEETLELIKNTPKTYRFPYA